MNPKLIKLRAEREKNAEKIKTLTQRNRDLDEQITKLENLEIIGLVREVGMTPDQLEALVRQNIQPTSEEETYEEN